MYPNTEINHARLDQESERFLRFALSAFLIKQRTQEASVLPLKGGGIIMQHVSSHDRTKCNIPCSNEHQGRGPEIRTNCEAPNGQHEGWARISIAHRVGYVTIVFIYCANNGSHYTSVIRKNHQPVI
jgi:hypothetical protein